MMIEDLFRELSERTEVEAIALGGSRAGRHYDEKSDYDVYVYCTEAVPEEVRERILSKYCEVIEIGNHYWEYEDNGTLKNGIDIDILYRNLDDFLMGISEVVNECQAHNGYTTCMWHNLLTCKIIYDKEKHLAGAKEKYAVPYPKKLQQNIIERNMKLLRHSLPAYETQIKKAVKRGDLVSVNHRTAEFMASYFDILFAMNELTHPGEKRLVELCEKNCRILPEHFRENIETLFADMFEDVDKVPADIDRIIGELESVVKKDVEK